MALPNRNPGISRRDFGRMAALGGSAALFCLSRVPAQVSSHASVP